VAVISATPAPESDTVILFEALVVSVTTACPCARLRPLAGR
jgi:hypothetical protein